MLNTIKEFFKGKFNFKLMKCYKSIKLKMLNNNIGFWIMNIIIIMISNYINWRIARKEKENE